MTSRSATPRDRSRSGPLQKKIMKLPRNLKGQAVAELNYRLEMLPQSLQMPKGPVPRSARMPKPPRPRTR